jgi:hypothetical protein
MTRRAITGQPVDLPGKRDLPGKATIEAYLAFAACFLEYVTPRLQAVIVSQNEPHYTFWQYPEEGRHVITRPINSNLMYRADEATQFSREFRHILDHLREPEVDTNANRACLNRAVYTIQQCIGATLDALPEGMSNKARKLNGDLFEHLIRLVIQRIGVDCTSGTVSVPVEVDGEETFSMKYQHDLIIKSGELVKVLGSVKTTSKDRIDKIFLDKFLFTRLTGKNTPHVAIFLNDVQRKGTAPRYGINSTFLPGHFKGYTVKLNPLDGVYYCDIRPAMRTEPILRDHIKTFDHLLFGDVWELLARDPIVAEVKESKGEVEE